MWYGRARDMVKIAIVEDEITYIEKLIKYINQYQVESGNKIKVTKFMDGEDIANEYSGKYDIILMDIQMRFMEGMTAAEHIRQRDKEVIIMFITNMTQYAIRGYEVDALDYVLKPVEYFTFSQKLDRAIERLDKKDSFYITIPIDCGFQKIDVSSIYFVESQGHTLIYYTNKGTYTTRGKMKDLEDMLEIYGFFRIGKGYLVNIKLVDGIRKNSCVINGQELPISRSKKKDFIDCLVQYISGVTK